MLKQVSLSGIGVSRYAQNSSIPKTVQNPIQNVDKLPVYSKVSTNKLVDAYKGYNNINLASTVSFGSSLAGAIYDVQKSMITCRDAENGQEGEKVGERIDVNDLVGRFTDDLKNYEDAIKTTIPIKEEEKDGVLYITDARAQVKKGSHGKMKLGMTVRMPRKSTEKPARTDDFKQNIQIQVEPSRLYHNKVLGTPEIAYILNTKGNLMAVVEDVVEKEEDGKIVQEVKNVLLTDTGKLTKKDSTKGALEVEAEKYEAKDKPNKFDKYSVPVAFEVRKEEGGSDGGGTELVIGLEKGRFVEEIIQSIEEFRNKVNNGDIVLERFKPAKDVENIQIAMLAGGFGSRAEYANASSTKIMHGREYGSNLTKGCFRTATGFTPMETSFISLHKAGYLDCSKENFGIGKNIKFYLNDSGKNRGNGGFSVDLYNVMEREGRKSLLILPNDAMSRMPWALGKVNEMINSGNVAMVMIAKQVKKEDVIGKLGIMKINNEGLIEGFAEKPKELEPGYVYDNDKCYANTFQFAVSKEAFDVLNMLEDKLGKNDNKNKESRDWSKAYTPVLMAITRNDDIEKMREEIIEKTGIIIPKHDLEIAKEKLGNQKIYAIKTAEPWADCGTLNALYHTTREIATGDFPLTDQERYNVIQSVNPETGLIASTPELKKEIEAKYTIDGQIMAVPLAEPADPEVIERNKSAITRYSSKH